MFLPGQVVWNRKERHPQQITDDVWDVSQYKHGDLTHFIEHTGQWTKVGNDYVDAYRIAFPKSVSEALKLLDAGAITPAAVMPKK